MKRIIVLILCGALLHYSHAWASETNDPPAQPNCTLIELAVFVAISAVVLSTATYVIVKVRANIPDYNKPVTLVLWRSFNAVQTMGGGYSGTWEPIATNTVVLQGITPVEAFSDIATNSLAVYKATILK